MATSLSQGLNVLCLKFKIQTDNVTLLAQLYSRVVILLTLCMCKTLVSPHRYTNRGFGSIQLAYLHHCFVEMSTKPGKYAVMYTFVDFFLCFYEISISFWICSDSLVFFIYLFLFVLHF